MKVKRPAPVRGDRRPGARQSVRGAARRTKEAPPRKRRPIPEQRPARSAPQTGPIPRPRSGPARPKNTSQAKARAKARKAKAPKVVRPPLRERLLVRLASIELNPRELVSRVPFVVLVIAALGIGLGITLWLSTGSAERSYQLGHARQTNQGLLQQKEALERDVLEAQAAPALAEAARNLGMIPSRDTAHLVQDPAGNWVVVGTPKPAEGVPPPPLNTPLPEAAPPPPPAPPAPRVLDPREVTVRMPQAVP
ncbi:membrane protein, partial [Mycobacterium sp. SWH-M3]